MSGANSHIVFVTPGFPKDEKDTQCIPALQIYLKALREQTAARLTVLTIHYPFKRGSYSWHGVRVHALGGRNRSMLRPLHLRRARSIFEKIFSRNKITQIHSFWIGECCFLASKMASKFDVPHVCTAMGQDVRAGNPWVRRITSTPKYICLSRFQAQVLENNYGLDSRIIHWGLPPNNLSADEKSIDVVGVGSLISLKAFDQFIRIIAELKNTFSEINCLIVGEGPEKDALGGMIDNLNLIANVELVGALSYQATQALIAKSCILLHPSQFESFGMVVIEALALGASVVARPVGIAAEISNVHKMNSNEGAVEIISKILKRGENTSPVSYPILETIRQYADIYNMER